MSEKFKVGDICITQNARFHPELDGTEVTIVAILAPGLYQIDLINPIDGQGFIADAHQLRKKRPPESDDAEARQAMLDCIERAKQPQGVPA